ncbi:energy transducer TonB [Algoriphagus marinus]|uniref:energy transducer TonB n=1 Tax=Algoriphagus marinus TaxID=1925762 RepID=UPI00094B90AF|nr:energy transducer TonB [Algoriphagus marinus]
MKISLKIGVASLALFAFSAFLETSEAMAQTQQEIHKEVDQMPVPPGGMEGFTKYMIENLKYPASAKENKIEGKVFVSFVVKPDGSIENPEIIRGIGGGCDEEAMRMVANSGTWTPGIKDGKAVATQMVLPVMFKL